ncbi:hypothetical protein Cni_G28363 [Canna indica]|uniref:HHO5-like N-terminal domain-containing protein n=1 Tax=Canna indica TaxID=4628 RepID=A0AAQ3QS95_9LILI|nr:hypothetical protein Cni_G28363 [Canna indica]
MGSAVAEMGLELDLCAARTVGGFVKEATSATMECGERERAARLEDSIKSLEGERRKIEAFERELPLCMHLLSEVIKELKREIGRRCFGERFGHGFAEFLPIKSKVDEDRGAIVASDCKDKMNWMSSVQLWSDNYCENNDDDKKIDKMIFKEEDGGSHHREGEDNFFLECKSQIGGITFLPLKELSRFKEEKPTAPFPDLSLRSPAINPVLSISVVEDHSVGVRKAVGKATESSPVTVGAHFNLQPQQQPSRKSRRCWSQDLHRRFVVAIQRLGGAQRNKFYIVFLCYFLSL